MSDKNDLPEKNLKAPVNHLLNAINEFFQQAPAKGFIESMDELFTASPLFNTIPVDLHENDNYYIVKAKLPGIKKEQIDIDVFNQHLTISVRHEETTLTENKKKEIVHRKDLFRQATRTVPLAKAINPNKISANYENGLLTIHVQKVKGKRVHIE